MDLNLTPNEQQFRDEFRVWLKTNLPEEWKGVTSTEDRDDYIEYLRDWQRKGIVRTAESLITIANRAALENLAEPGPE